MSDDSPGFSSMDHSFDLNFGQDSLDGAAAAKISSGGAPGRWTPLPVEEVARLLPQYEIISLLGCGGMGAVYSGRQIALDRRVAIKFLSPEISIHQDFVDRFVREARAMARLEHPNIVAVHDFGQTSEGHLYFVMDYVHGVTLRQLLLARKQFVKDNIPPEQQSFYASGLPVEEALPLMIQVCEALHYAHNEGVVHRDIKPPNILVDNRGRVKVADFGLVRLIGASESEAELTFTGLVMGTPDYMAPEQRHGMKVDHRADIYSTGVMLYELLVGELPHGAFRRASELVEGIHPHLDAIVHRALQSAPKDRYQSSQEMRDDLVTVRDSAPTTSAPVVPPKAPLGQKAHAAPARRQGFPILPLGLAAGGIAIAVAGFVLWPKKGNSDAAHADRPIAAHAAIQSPSAASVTNPLSAAVTSRGDVPDQSRIGTSASGKGLEMGASPANALAPSEKTPRPWLISKTANVPAPADAIEFQGSKFKLVQEECTWLEAKAKAESMGGHLAVTTQREVQDFIGKQFGKAFGESTWFWIGAFLPPGETQPRWVTGEMSGRLAWRDKQPQNPGEAARKLPTAVAHYWSSKYAEEPGWSAVPWNEKRTGFLVEWDRFSAADAVANEPSEWRSWPDGAQLASSQPVGGADKERATFLNPGYVFANGAVRVRFESANGKRVEINLRQSKPPGSASLARYYALRLFSSELSLHYTVYDVNARSNAEDKSVCPSLPNPGFAGSHTLEFRAVGNLLSAYLDNELLASAQDAELAKGSMVVLTQGGVHVVDISTLDFDSSESKASRIAKETSVNASKARLPTEMEKWLAQVDGQMQGNYQREALKPFETGLSELKKGYLAALDQRINSASASGKLDEALAWRAERQRFNSATPPLPADDSDLEILAVPSVAKELGSLRLQCRAQLNKLESQRLAKAQILFASYGAALAPNITLLTQRNRLDDALLLKNKLESLKVLWLQSADNSQASSPDSRPTLKKYPKGDDRKAAEWVLRVGGSVTLEQNGSSIEVSLPQEFPTGAFALTGVRLDFYEKNPKEPIRDLEMLAGLPRLAKIETAGLPFQNEHLAPLTSLPQLKSLDVHGAEFTDDAVGYLSVMPSLEEFGAQACRLWTGRRIGELAGHKLQKLGLYFCPLAAEAFPSIARNQQFVALDLTGTPANSGDLVFISKLSGLQELYLNRTRVTASGLSALGGLGKLRTLGWDFSSGKAAEELAEVSKLFPSLTTYRLDTAASGPSRHYLEGDIAALAVFHKLTHLTVKGPGFGDEAARGVLALNGLQHFWSLDNSGLTDAGLATLSRHETLQAIYLDGARVTDDGLLQLASLRKLYYLLIHNCPLVTKAGIDAFQKARPDVTLSK